jgi:hypothetical protein
LVWSNWRKAKNIVLVKDSSNTHTHTHTHTHTKALKPWASLPEFGSPVSPVLAWPWILLVFRISYSIYFVFLKKLLGYFKGLRKTQLRNGVNQTDPPFWLAMWLGYLDTVRALQPIFQSDFVIWKEFNFFPLCNLVKFPN